MATDEICMPAVVAFMQPFRLVLGETDKWQCSIDDVNNGTYDYVKLCKHAVAVDVDMRPFSMLVCVDGALVLPATESLRIRENAARKFNTILARLFLGGIYADRVEPSDIYRGDVLRTWYVRTYPNEMLGNSALNHDLRCGEASSLRAILLESPNRISTRSFAEAFAFGNRAMAAVPDISAEFLIQSATNLRRHSWSESLASSWIMVEQITSYLWDFRVVAEAKALQGSVENRTHMLRDDRTFTTAVKLEVLFQRGVLDLATLRSCLIARRARNRLSHAGEHSTRSEALASFESVFRLLAISDGKGSDEYLDRYQRHVDDHATDRPQPRELPKDAVRFWRKIKPLPGEEFWTGAPFEAVPGDPVPISVNARSPASSPPKPPDCQTGTL